MRCVREKVGVACRYGPDTRFSDATVAAVACGIAAAAAHCHARQLMHG
eukprot:COSAG01_NODE_58204_length_307_cov_1.197115_1_plen_47_part_10